MNYIITIYSKNKKSIINFFQFFNQKLLPTTRCSIVTLQKQKKKTFKTISILKSPHVNKKAQMHFGSQKLSKQIFIYSVKPTTFFMVLKKIQNRLFPDIKLKITATVKPKYLNRLGNKLLNPKKFLLNTNNPHIQKFVKKKTTIISQTKISPLKSKICMKKFFNTQLESQTVQYLKIWDYYGEINFITSY